MTATAGETRVTSKEVRAAVTAFFDAYRDHDVERMVDLCTENADFHYVPVEVSGRQRVIRGDGKVRTIGKVFWTALIDAFPDLTNSVTSIVHDEHGNAAAEVVIAGTQAKVFGTIGNRGLHYELPHVFLFRVDPDALIDEVTAYWDSADWYRQLGRMEVD
jgi:steroid delta-isomerase-like uncharacterized protein